MKGKLLLLLGAFLMAFPAVIAILTIFGVMIPVVFPPTGKPLDVMPLVNALTWWLMLILLLYIGTRVIDWSIKYLREEN
jgi:hypothetical protein